MVPEINPTLGFIMDKLRSYGRFRHFVFYLLTCATSPFYFSTKLCALFVAIM
jgi:hypothetical protein